MPCFRQGCERHVHKLVRIERPVPPAGFCWGCAYKFRDRPGVTVEAEAPTPTTRRSELKFAGRQ